MVYWVMIFSYRFINIKIPWDPGNILPWCSYILRAAPKCFGHLWLTYALYWNFHAPDTHLLLAEEETSMGNIFDILYTAQHILCDPHIIICPFLCKTILYWILTIHSTFSILSSCLQAAEWLGLFKGAIVQTFLMVSHIKDLVINTISVWHVFFIHAS